MTMVFLHFHHFKFSVNVHSLTRCLCSFFLFLPFFCFAACSGTVAAINQHPTTTTTPMTTTACLVSFATEAVMQLCHGRRRCTISADTQTFGNPCRPDSRMYLKTVYTCGKFVGFYSPIHRQFKSSRSFHPFASLVFVSLLLFFVFSLPAVLCCSHWFHAFFVLAGLWKSP